MLFVESVICVILGYGGYLVYKGSFNAGQLVEFIGYFTSVVWPIMAVSELIDMTSRGKASLERIGQLLDAKQDVFDKTGAADLTEVRGDIEFKNLTFRYPDGEFDALENISFTIKAGENVGLVGKTGSGKTTLVDLLLRTYNVPDGTVFIDGRDVNDVTIRSLRQFCAYVPQDNFLFSDTIENNISFGVPENDHTGIEEAAKLADIHENISGFQLGYAEADIDAFPATYYYRITEVNDKDDVLANDQVFLVEVQVTKTDGTLNAQVVNRWSCSNDENGMLLKEAVSSITFQNTIAGSLTLSKQVVGAVPEGGFTFNIALKDANGDPVTGTFDAVFHQQDGTTEETTVYPNAEGVITLNAFNHGEKAVINGIPVGTAWTITETNADGYVVTYTVNNGEDQSGAESGGTIIVGSTEVVYTNTAMYKLPETGGGGVAKILTCGGLLALMPCLWLLRRQRYRGRRVTGG